MTDVKELGFYEMNDQELQKTDGGVWWEVAVAIWVLYEVGYAIGKGIAHATN